MQHVEGMPERGFGGTLACADTAAEAGPCMDRLTAGEPSLELPSEEFAHARIAGWQDTGAYALVMGRPEQVYTVQGSDHIALNWDEP